MSKKLTNDEFINKSNIIHKFKYDYSDTMYINRNTNVIIKCPLHGSFHQLPSNHLSGKGCKKCGIERTSKKQESNKNDFIKKAVLIHGLKYNYDKVEYIKCKTKVIITCFIHGDFQQTVSDHLSGCGCPYCGILSQKKKQASNTNEFIKKAKQIHNDKYDYSKVDYKHYKTKIIIICPIHGEFLQTPSGHLSGKGCLQCAIDKHIGENNNNYKGGISPLEEYLRGVIKQWKKDSMRKSKYKCVITGRRFDVIHHLYGFNKIVDEALIILGFKSNQINGYSKDELKNIDEVVIFLHKKYGEGVCLSREIHNLFHKKYGYGDNTVEQFEEFKKEYEEGRYDLWLRDIG